LVLDLELAGVEHEPARRERPARYAIAASGVNDAERLARQGHAREGQSQHVPTSVWAVSVVDTKGARTADAFALTHRRTMRDGRPSVERAR
jgi:hypothetical protein